MSTGSGGGGGRGRAGGVGQAAEAVVVAEDAAAAEIGETGWGRTTRPGSATRLEGAVEDDVGAGGRRKRDEVPARRASPARQSGAQPMASRAAVVRIVRRGRHMGAHWSNGGGRGSTLV